MLRCYASNLPVGGSGVQGKSGVNHSFVQIYLNNITFGRHLLANINLKIEFDSWMSRTMVNFSFAPYNDTPGSGLYRHTN